MPAFPHLFTPGRVGTLTLKNRVVFAATSSELADHDGFAGDDMAEYYAERARGGVGLIIVEATYVEQEGKRLHHNAMLHEDRYIPGMRKLADAVHAAGGKIALQLNHGGRESIPEISGSVPLGPSPVPSQFTAVGAPVMPKELTVAEIQRIIRRFVEATVRCKLAGFDAVELHGAHGYLIGQFLSPESNRREDAYGGSTEGRARFFVEMVQAIKKELGNFPIICRMNGRDHSPGGLELNEAVEIALMLEKAGADSVSVSGGIHSSRPYMIVPGMSVERGCYVAYGEAMKKRLKVPVMTVGRITTPRLSEEILAEGKADYICLSRPLIADPHFAAKAEAGQADRITPCIACNECLATIHKHKGIACTVNPMVSRELQYKPLLAKKVSPRRVVVVGAGAAGMAAAVTAARRGHVVHMFEKDKVIGGQLILAHQPPHREEIEGALTYFSAEVKRLDVDVRVGAMPTVNDVRTLKPDAIIVATGAEASTPRDLPGADLPHVLIGWHVLAGHVQTGKNCVVVGGGLVGVEVADYLAHRGRTVALIARSEMLKKAVHADRVYFMDRIKELDVEVFTHAKVHGIGPNTVDIEPAGRLRRTLTGVDNVIFCTGYQPRAAESEGLKALGVPVHFAGDVLGSRKFFEAIEEGTLAALNIT